MEETEVQRRGGTEKTKRKTIKEERNPSRTGKETCPAEERRRRKDKKCRS